MFPVSGVRERAYDELHHIVRARTLVRQKVRPGAEYPVPNNTYWRDGPRGQGSTDRY